MYFGQFLIENGVISRIQLEKGLEEQKKKQDMMIGTILADMGYLSHQSLDEYLLQHMALSAESLTSEL